MSRRSWSWVALAAVLAAALFVGAQGDGSPPTDEERAHRIASQIRCPTCRSQSAADSDAPAAQFVREETLRRVREGQSDAQIIGYFEGRYGEQIRLNPSGGGVGALVWALPVVAVGAAVTGLVLAYRRSRPGRRSATAGDRALVEEALRSD
ncbi:MAG: cytochrome c-type biogenesis protein CcmH [Acidimicrobiia bacterium]